MRTRVIRQAASYLLSYPDGALLDRVPVLRAALAEQRTHDLDAFLDHLESTPRAELERQYVEVFDLSRRHALYLSYWTDGDTRRRGEVLGSFKAAYR
ncbi:MAG: nitrate reductase molybdenum cofactor assembly chaperone, partial [Actinomycetales bacterium]